MVALPVEGRIRSLAFSPGGHGLAVASAAGVFWIADTSGLGTVSTLFDPAGEMFRPVGVAVSADQAKVLAADQSGSVISIALAGGAATTIACHCQPEGLFGMGAGVFRLTGLSGGSIRLFEAASGRVLFAPVGLDEGSRP
jgi:hypothetical protein